METGAKRRWRIRREEHVGGVAPTYGAVEVDLGLDPDFDLDLDLDLPGPLRSGGVGGSDPQGAAHGCAACAFFAPGFFAQAKKGGSRRHGAKAFDLDSAVAWREKNRSSSLRSPPHPALRATFSRKREKGFLIRQAGEVLSTGLPPVEEGRWSLGHRDPRIRTTPSAAPP